MQHRKKGEKKGERQGVCRKKIDHLLPSIALLLQLAVHDSNSLYGTYANAMQIGMVGLRAVHK